MALASNALITVPEFIDYLGATTQASEVLSAYHDQGDSATAATISVAGGLLTFTITGGADAGSVTFTLTSATTITLVAANATLLARGWIMRVIGSGETTLDMLQALASTSAYGAAQEQFLAAINTTRLVQAVNFASQAVESYCFRTFASATYTHLYSGKSRDKLKLRQGPITRVDRLSIGRKGAFKVINNSTDAISAQVQLTSTELRLDVVGGVNESSSTVAYTGSTTISSMLTSINALGKGWVASLDTGAQSTWLVADCMEADPKNALNSNMLVYVPEQNVDEFVVNKDAGIITLLGGASRSSLLNMVPVLGAIRPPELRPLTAQYAGAFFPEGKYNVYVKYVAGYASIPEDIKWACCEIAANVYHASQRDTSLRMEKIEGYSWDKASIFGAGTAKALPEEVKSRLARYRFYMVPEFAAA